MLDGVGFNIHAMCGFFKWDYGSACVSINYFVVPWYYVWIMSCHVFKNIEIIYNICLYIYFFG